MSDLFSLLPLGPKQIDQAYPIVQSIVPDLDVSVWRDFAEQIAARPRDQAGIITVQSQGYIHGLFSYVIEPHLIHERILLVDNLFVLDLFNPGAVAEGLLDAVDDLAEQHHCRVIHTSVPKRPSDARDQGDWILSLFKARGHCLENMTLCKRLAQRHRRLAPDEGSTREPSRVVTMAHRRERCRFSM